MPDAAKNKQEEWRGRVVRLSWKPRAFLFKRFLSDDECDHLVNMVRAGPAAVGCSMGRCV